MKNSKIVLVAFVIAVFLAGGPVWAHVTPNVVLSTTREALVKLLPTGGKLFQKEAHLSDVDWNKLKSFGNWAEPDQGWSGGGERDYKFFISRDQNNIILRAVVFVSEFTRHGQVMVAVALDGNGQVTDALVTDVQEEPLEWVEPLLVSNYMAEFKGKDSSMSLQLGAKWSSMSTMSQAYALSIANAVKRGAQLFDLIIRPTTAKK